jgi:hypothetical protein
MQIHVQHAAGDKAAGENEEEAGVAAHALPESQPYHRAGGRMRSSLASLEDALPLGGILHGTLAPGQSDPTPSFSPVPAHNAAQLDAK